MRRAAPTAREFEARYAERSGLTVGELRASGRIVIPCHCEAPDCPGWRSISERYAGDELTRMGIPGAVRNYAEEGS